jgi:UDP-glucuronate decarboxylase
VDDLIEGRVKLMQPPTSSPAPLNLGNPAECTTLELAEQVLALTGSRSPIFFEPLPSDDPVQRQPEDR